jgi:hypothetical protein
MKIVDTHVHYGWTELRWMGETFEKVLEVERSAGVNHMVFVGPVEAFIDPEETRKTGVRRNTSLQ